MLQWILHGSLISGSLKTQILEHVVICPNKRKTSSCEQCQSNLAVPTYRTTASLIGPAVWSCMFPNVIPFDDSMMSEPGYVAELWGDIAEYQ